MRGEVSCQRGLHYERGYLRGHAGSVGILAFGSLIDDPGPEIDAAFTGRKLNVRTPFRVEFARASTKRYGAPTLVPVQQGGASVPGQILLVNVSEREAKDRLWRREIDKIGLGGHYIHRIDPGPNMLIIDRYENFEGPIFSNHQIIDCRQFSGTRHRKCAPSPYWS
jgi:hypothetical protein